MVHLATCVALLSLGALWGLVPTPYLLTLHWGILGASLGTVVGKMAGLSTLEAGFMNRSVGHTRSHRGSCRSVLARLWVVGAWSLWSELLELLNWVLKLLNIALELILPKTSTQTSRTKLRLQL